MSETKEEREARKQQLKDELAAAKEQALADKLDNDNRRAAYQLGLDVPPKDNRG